MAPYFFIHSPAAKLAYAPKTGRVVDIATGVGIADVTVVVTAYYYSEINKNSAIDLLVYSILPVAGHTVKNELYTLVVKTDEHGGFKTPNIRDKSWEKR